MRRQRKIVAGFQFTPLREGRRLIKFSSRLPIYFNSRPSARGDSAACQCQLSRPLFQFTPLREGRRVNFPGSPTSFIFQFTPLREGRQIVSAFSQSCLLFQFTPLREGRLCRGLYFLYRPHISIHAPPRGATSSVPDSPDCRKISIHAPPRGATDCQCVQPILPFISIHAPPRGAT